MEGVFEVMQMPVGAEIKHGVATLSTYEFKRENDPIYNMRAMMNGGLMYMVDGKYVRLHVERTLMMSDTRMEKKSNLDFIRSANGRVLIGGLGIGLIIHNLREKIAKGIVTEIVVIEKYQDVIDLVGQFYKDLPCLKIICADMMEYRSKEKFDTIYFDIWPVISEDNLDDIKVLHNRWKYNLNRSNPNCWMNSWMKEHLQREKAKSRRGSYYW